jgi:DNA-directed RNA polymerase beta' subunit
MFQSKVLANTLDVVGRAAISPNPSLDMDQVGIPESMAWKIYQPFIMRRLARMYNTGTNRVFL